MKKILVLLSLTILLLLPNIVSADCLDLGNFTSWVRENEHPILFYTRDIPIARRNISDCEIYPFSKIRLIKSYMCDDDTIVIDGKTCSIITVEALYYNPIVALNFGSDSSNHLLFSKSLGVSTSEYPIASPCCNFA